MLFAQSSVRSTLGELVNRPFNRWSKVTKVIRSHSFKDYHKNAYMAANSFVKTIEEPQTKISNLMNSKKLANIEQNRQLLTHIVRAVVFLSKQGLAFRGHDETKTSKNGGNFLELL